jgi:hypothetical protein
LALRAAAAAASFGRVERIGALAGFRLDARPRARHRHVRGRRVGVPDIIELQLFRDRNVNALNRGQVERRAERGTLGARTIVAFDR